MLVTRALENDQHAFALLFRRHAPDVHAFAQRRSRSADIADDVVATTFEKAWRSLARLGADDGDRFRPWVFRIAANELASHFRSQGRRTRREQLAAVRDGQGEAGPAGGQPDPDVPADDGSVVLEALATLPDRHQEVISLRYLADLSPAETARALGIEKSHVAVRLHRAMTALRAAITAADSPGGAS